MSWTFARYGYEGQRPGRVLASQPSGAGWTGARTDRQYAGQLDGRDGAGRLARAETTLIAATSAASSSSVGSPLMTRISGAGFSSVMVLAVSVVGEKDEAVGEMVQKERRKAQRDRHVLKGAEPA